MRSLIKVFFVISLVFGCQAKADERTHLDKVTYVTMLLKFDEALHAIYINSLSDEEFKRRCFDEKFKQDFRIVSRIKYTTVFGPVLRQNIASAFAEERLDIIINHLTQTPVGQKMSGFLSKPELLIAAGSEVESLEIGKTLASSVSQDDINKTFVYYQNDAHKYQLAQALTKNVYDVFQQTLISLKERILPNDVPEYRKLIEEQVVRNPQGCTPPEDKLQQQPVNTQTRN